MSLEAKVNLLLEIELERQRHVARTATSYHARKATDYARRLEVALS